MKGRLLLIVAMVVAAYLVLQFAMYKQPVGQHDQPFVWPKISLPHLNLNAAPALAASLNQSSSPSSSPGYKVTGVPTISASFIDQVLAAYHSSAAGLGQVLYDDGVKYGIDPAFALAFFMHESTFGEVGMARTTLSLGNLRCIPNHPCIQGYAGFGSWEQGFEEWYKLIKNLYVATWHKVTVAQIVPTYAPKGDHNNVDAYIAAIEHAVDTWRSGKVVVQ